MKVGRSSQRKQPIDYPENLPPAWKLKLVIKSVLESDDKAKLKLKKRRKSLKRGKAKKSDRFKNKKQAPASFNDDDGLPYDHPGRNTIENRLLEQAAYQSTTHCWQSLANQVASLAYLSHGKKFLVWKYGAMSLIHSNANSAILNHFTRVMTSIALQQAFPTIILDHATTLLASGDVKAAIEFLNNQAKKMSKNGSPGERAHFNYYRALARYVELIGAKQDACGTQSLLGNQAAAKSLDSRMKTRAMSVVKYVDTMLSIDHESNYDAVINVAVELLVHYQKIVKAEELLEKYLKVNPFQPSPYIFLYTFLTKYFSKDEELSKVTACDGILIDLCDLLEDNAAEKTRILMNLVDHQEWRASEEVWRKLAKTFVTDVAVCRDVSQIRRIKKEINDRSTWWDCYHFISDDSHNERGEIAIITIFKAIVAAVMYGADHVFVKPFAESVERLQIGGGYKLGKAIEIAIKIRKSIQRPQDVKAHAPDEPDQEFLDHLQKFCRNDSRDQELDQSSEHYADSASQSLKSSFADTSESSDSSTDDDDDGSLSNYTFDSSSTDSSMIESDHSQMAEDSADKHCDLGDNESLGENLSYGGSEVEAFSKRPSPELELSRLSQLVDVGIGQSQEKSTPSTSNKITSSSSPRISGISDVLSTRSNTGDRPGPTVSCRSNRESISNENYLERFFEELNAVPGKLISTQGKITSTFDIKRLHRQRVSASGETTSGIKEHNFNGNESDSSIEFVAEAMVPWGQLSAAVANGGKEKCVSKPLSALNFGDESNITFCGEERSQSQKNYGLSRISTGHSSRGEAPFTSTQVGNILPWHHNTEIQNMGGDSCEKEIISSHTMYDSLISELSASQTTSSRTEAAVIARGRCPSDINFSPRQSGVRKSTVADGVAGSIANDAPSIRKETEINQSNSDNLGAELKDAGDPCPNSPTEQSVESQRNTSHQSAAELTQHSWSSESNLSRSLKMANNSEIGSLKRFTTAKSTAKESSLAHARGLSGARGQEKESTCSGIVTQVVTNKQSTFSKRKSSCMNAALRTTGDGEPSSVLSINSSYSLGRSELDGISCRLSEIERVVRVDQSLRPECNRRQTPDPAVSHTSHNPNDLYCESEDVHITPTHSIAKKAGKKKRHDKEPKVTATQCAGQNETSDIDCTIEVRNANMETSSHLSSCPVGDLDGSEEDGTVDVTNYDEPKKKLKIKCTLLSAECVGTDNRNQSEICDSGDPKEKEGDNGLEKTKRTKRITSGEGGKRKKQKNNKTSDTKEDSAGEKVKTPATLVPQLQVGSAHCASDPTKTKKKSELDAGSHLSLSPNDFGKTTKHKKKRKEKSRHRHPTDEVLKIDACHETKKGKKKTSTRDKSQDCGRNSESPIALSTISTTLTTPLDRHLTRKPKIKKFIESSVESGDKANSLSNNHSESPVPRKKAKINDYFKPTHRKKEGSASKSKKLPKNAHPVVGDNHSVQLVSEMGIGDSVAKPTRKKKQKSSEENLNIASVKKSKRGNKSPTLATPNTDASVGVADNGNGSLSNGNKIDDQLARKEVGPKKNRKHRESTKPATDVPGIKPKMATKKIKLKSKSGISVAADFKYKTDYKQKKKKHQKSDKVEKKKKSKKSGRDKDKPSSKKKKRSHSNSKENKARSFTKKSKPEDKK